MTRVVSVAAFVVVVGFIVFVVNQTAQVVALARTLSPTFGQVVLIALLIVYALVVVVGVVMFVRLPRALRPPSDATSPEYASYLKRLGARLTANPHLAGDQGPLRDRAGIDAALEILRTKARETMKRTASRVFLSTAISQSGRLDGLMVLAAQTRLVWQIAHIYNQRPTLRDMAQLYANVGATVFVVSEIEDLDVGEQIEPLITAVLGDSVLGLVPGAGVVATIVARSALDGAANAYLTLRIGAVCEQYCESRTAASRKDVRRDASVVAARMLGSVVSESGGALGKAIVTVAKKKGAAAFASGTSRLRSLGSRMGPRKRSDGPPGEMPP